MPITADAIKWRTNACLLLAGLKQSRGSALSITLLRALMSDFSLSLLEEGTSSALLLLVITLENERPAAVYLLEAILQLQVLCLGNHRSHMVYVTS